MNRLIEYPSFEQMTAALRTFAEHETTNHDLRDVIQYIVYRNEALIDQEEGHQRKKVPAYAVILTRRLWKRYCYRS